MLEEEYIQEFIREAKKVFMTKDDFSGSMNELKNKIVNLKLSIDDYSRRADEYLKEIRSSKVKTLAYQHDLIKQKTTIQLQ